MFLFETIVDDLDIRRHIFRGFKAIDRILGQRMVDQMIDRLGSAGHKARHRVMRFAHHAVQSGRIVAGERQLPGQQQVENDARRPDIRSSIGRLAQQPLRRDVVKGADHHARLGVAGAILEPGDAEVDDLDVAVRLHHDVCRLDVAVNHPFSVCVAQAGAELADNLQLLNQRELASILEQVLQRIAGHELHDDIGISILLAEVVDGDDVGVVQDAGAGLKHEAVAQFVGRLGNGLDGHFAADGLVQPSVDDPHAAYAQDAQDLVFADLCDCRACIHAIRGS